MSIIYIIINIQEGGYIIKLRTLIILLWQALIGFDHVGYIYLGGARQFMMTKRKKIGIRNFK